MPLALRRNVALTDTISTLWDAAVSKGTSSVYQAGFRAYCVFLTLHAITWITVVPPISEDLLIYFVAYCIHGLKIKASTIKSYLCGVRFHYLRAGFNNPLESPEGQVYMRLHTILTGAKKIHGQQRRPRLPITYNILHRMCHLLRCGVFTPFLDIMLETACTLAFCGFLRCGEFCTNHTFDSSLHMCVNDVEVCQSDQCIYLQLKVSKCDPFRKGIKITLFKSNSSVCPYNVVIQYLHVRKSLFVCSPSSPLFINDVNSPLTRAMFVSYIKKILDRLGINSALYNGHSFRIGAATSAAESHVPDHLIKTLGRWSSDCYVRYIHTSHASLQHAQRKILC